jgi:hypothetical protein
MAIYTADLKWTASEGEDFLKGRFSRAHTLSFDSGTVVPALASPHVVGKWAADSDCRTAHTFAMTILRKASAEEDHWAIQVSFALCVAGLAAWLITLYWNAPVDF